LPDPAAVRFELAAELEAALACTRAHGSLADLVDASRRG
jgi:hypothetical protein